MNARKPSSIAQTICSQRAAQAAQALHDLQRRTHRVRLADARRRPRSLGARGLAESEGKIKEAAPVRPPSQSARGFNAARGRVLRVPFVDAKPCGLGVWRVPATTPFYAPRQGLRHGHG